MGSVSSRRARFIGPSTSHSWTRRTRSSSTKRGFHSSSPESTADETVGLDRLAELARTLMISVDFDTDEHAHNIFLTDAGHQTGRRAAWTAATCLHPRTSTCWRRCATRSMPRSFLRRDVDYIVRDGSVELIDELTGRVAENRHWPDGLQAAVEAKEDLRPGAEGRILGSITLQHFLRLYPHLCGMTATALPAADELERDLWPRRGGHPAK